MDDKALCAKLAEKFGWSWTPDFNEFIAHRGATRGVFRFPPDDAPLWEQQAFAARVVTVAHAARSDELDWHRALFESHAAAFAQLGEPLNYSVGGRELNPARAAALAVVGE